jgi:hypothetical protein
VDDTVLLSKHFSNGVGQYQADWDRIEAEWYMAGNKIEKGETVNGFQVKSCYDQGYLYFPNIGRLRKNSKISLRVNPHVGGIVEVRSGSFSGPLLGTIDIPLESSKDYFMYSANLNNKSGQQDIYLVFRGEAGKNLFSIDWMKFD